VQSERSRRTPIPRVAPGSRRTALSRTRRTKAGGCKEAVRIAGGVAAAATDAVADARSPVPKLRWLLAVELITSGAAFRLFRTHGVPRHFHDADDESVGVSGATDTVIEDRRRLSVRFLRRALISDVLHAPVVKADALIEVKEAAGAGARSGDG
jgi:E3 ubiquitin-protein ligase SHPRH